MPKSDELVVYDNDIYHCIIQLVTGLQAYIEREEQRLRLLKTLVKDYRDVSDKASEDVEKFVGNPLHSYLLIKKLTSDFKELKKVVEDRDDNFFSNLTQHHGGLKWPSDDDLNGAAVALMRLQDTYKLDTASLAEGIINGENYGPELSASDCFEIGRQSYNNEDYYHTTLWMEQAMAQFDREEEKTVDKADILEHLGFSAYMSGNIRYCNIDNH